MTAIEEFYNEGIEKGIEKGAELTKIEAVLGMNENGIPISIIAKSLKITEEKVKAILAEHQK